MNQKLPRGNLFLLILMEIGIHHQLKNGQLATHPL
jgi:hypothetical protein